MAGVVGIVWRVSMPATMTEVAAAIRDLLEDGCARDEDELIASLNGRGVDLGVDPEGTVADVLESDDLPLVVPVGDGGYASLSALLQGRTVTHRLTAVEVEHDVVALGVDLAPLWCLTDSEVYHRLGDRTELVQAVRGLDDGLLAERGLPGELPDDFVWLLPFGTLERSGLGVGDLVGFTVRDHGFELTSVSDVDGAAEVGARLAEALGQRGEGEPDEIGDLVWQLCAEDPGFLVRPRPPLAEALAAAGLACQGDFVAPPGFDFGRWRTGRRVARVASFHRIGEDEALAVLALTRMYDEVADLLGTVQSAADAGESLDDMFSQADNETETAGSARVSVDGGSSGPGGTDARLVRDLIGFLDDARVMQALLVETIGAGRDGAAAGAVRRVPRTAGAARPPCFAALAAWQGAGADGAHP